MWRRTAAALLLGTLAGCVSVDTGPETGGVKPHWGKSSGPPCVPGLQGPYGAGVPMAAPYNTAPPGSAWAARQMMSSNLPLNMVQFNRGGAPGMYPSAALPPGGIISPPGMPFGPGAPAPPPPAGVVKQTGYAGGPGGVVNANIPPGMPIAGGVRQVQYSGYPPTTGIRFPAARTQVSFLRPSGMKVSWFTVGPDGRPCYSDTPIVAPGRYNFAQGAIYRLKLSNLPGRPGVELYPTLEVVPGNPKTEAFLAHADVPIAFTEADFKAVAERNYIVKVIYLPDPQYQDIAGAGIDEIVSTRLEPGQDPVKEALRRGCILLIIRMGSVDLEAPSTPPLTTPAPAAMPFPRPGMHGPVPPLVQVPYLGMPGQPGKMPPMPGMMPPGGMPGMPPGVMPGMPVAPGAVPAPPGKTPAVPASRGDASKGAAPGGPFKVPSVPLSPRDGKAAPKASVTPPTAPPIRGATETAPATLTSGTRATKAGADLPPLPGGSLPQELSPEPMPAPPLPGSGRARATSALPPPPLVRPAAAAEPAPPPPSLPPALPR